MLNLGMWLIQAELCEYDYLCFLNIDIRISKLIKMNQSIGER